MKINQNVVWKKRIKIMIHVVLVGVKVGPNNSVAITSQPTSKTITSILGFLGLTGYYKRFIKNYAWIVASLTSLLKTYAFRWNDVANACFKKMNTLMTSTPILATQDFTKPFVLECDA